MACLFKRPFAKMNRSLNSDVISDLQDAFDENVEEGCLHQDGWFSNATAEGILGYKLIVQTGDMDEPVDKNRVWSINMETNFVYTVCFLTLQVLHGRLVDDEGIIFAPAFYCYVSAWTSNDALAYAASQADFRPLPREWYHDMTELELRSMIE
jgi:patched 1 protein